MSTQNINRLVGEFMDQYQDWEDAPSSQDWDRLRALAREGAQAYNEGSGPSFHILAFDGYPHDEFHERFLGYLLDAGFDPFKTVRTADGGNYAVVFNHEGLAEAAKQTPTAARMMQRMQEMARERLANADENERRRIMQLCQDAIPAELLGKIGAAAR
jgi:hypothetical protein